MDNRTHIRSLEPKGSSMKHNLWESSNRWDSSDRKVGTYIARRSKIPRHKHYSNTLFSDQW